MTEPIDQYFYDCIERWRAEEGAGPEARGPAESVSLSVEDCLAYFDAQLQSRHLDFAARWLQCKARGLLHHRLDRTREQRGPRPGAGCRRPGAAPLPLRRFLRRPRGAGGGGPTAGPRRVARPGGRSADPISGGRHKVFGHPALSVIPQTSTIGSHLPRAIGLAFSVGAGARPACRYWPADAVVVTTLGDASVNHSTAQGP